MAESSRGQAREQTGQMVARAWRGRILHALGPEECALLPDGGLLVDEQGYITACDDWSQLESTGRLKGYKTIALPPHMLIMPGMVDMHVHLPQMAVTGCQEKNLLSWLERYIFPEESRFADTDYARRISRWFFQQLLQNGTTTAGVFLTSHDEATRIAFEEAETAGNRVIMGQNLMDQNAPDALIKPAAQMLAETEAHCRHWHGRDQGRLQYAWVPRFALTSSEELLAGIGRLRQQHPDVYLHTHLSEQLPEIEAVRKQFPWATDYTAVYERFHLLGPRTILAHGIHLSDHELSRIEQHQASLAHCPGSNFFLKSGRFRWLSALAHGVRFGLGSDVGAGPELSLFKAMKDAQFMQDEHWLSLEGLFYRATLGGAQALWLDDRIGNFLPGKEADFILVDCRAKPGFLPPAESEQAELETNPLSRLIYLGDDRMIAATYVRGRPCFNLLPNIDFPLAVEPH